MPKMRETRAGPRREKPRHFEGTEQAACLRARGDLGATRVRFEAVLPSPTVADDSLLASLGMELELARTEGQGAAAQGRRLLVVSNVVAARLGIATPVGQWNAKQDRMRQLQLMVRPGDRIWSVNGCKSSYDAILAELHSGREASSIEIERDLPDILQPAGEAPLKLLASRASTGFVRRSVKLIQAANLLNALTRTKEREATTEPCHAADLESLGRTQDNRQHTEGDSCEDASLSKSAAEISQKQSALQVATNLPPAVCARGMDSGQLGSSLPTLLAASANRSKMHCAAPDHGWARLPPSPRLPQLLLPPQS